MHTIRFHHRNNHTDKAFPSTDSVVDSFTVGLQVESTGFLLDPPNEKIDFCLH